MSSTCRSSCRSARSRWTSGRAPSTSSPTSTRRTSRPHCAPSSMTRPESRTSSMRGWSGCAGRSARKKHPAGAAACSRDVPLPRLSTAACDPGHARHTEGMTQNSARRRVLITGATGGVGSHLATTLDGDYDLVLHGRSPETAPEGMTLKFAELGDYPHVLALMEGVDTVVHMAGAASPESSWELVLEANIIGVRNMLEAAREAGVRRVVLASDRKSVV